MQLLGPFGILFFAGTAMLIAGSAAVIAMLRRHGGLDRSRTLSVVFDEDSPMRKPEHRGDRWLFRVGVFVAGFGLVTVYTSVSVGDAREARVCHRRCVLQGYDRGVFAPSTVDVDAHGKPLRGCFCIGPSGSTELRPLRAPLPRSPLG